MSSIPFNLNIAASPVSSRAAIPKIGEAVDRGVPFSVDPITLKVKTLNPLERLWHYNDQSYYAKLNEQTVAAFKRILDPLTGLLPNGVLDDPLVRTISRFYRRLQDAQNKQQAIIEGKDELLAIKLGIDPLTLNLPKNAAFKQFAIVNHIDRYMGTYGHRLEINPFTSDISIRINERDPSKDIRWNDLVNSKKIDNNGKIRGVYTQSGISDPVPIGDGKFANWTEFKPFMNKASIYWGYRFEFCAWSVDAGPRCEGDHSWFRLYTPEGEIYSAGIYRPGKVPGASSRCSPLRKQLASLLSPDPSEVWGDPTYKTLQVEITEAQFKEIVKGVNALKKKEIDATLGKADPNIFQGFGENCTQFVNDMARLANIEIPTARMYPKVFYPKLTWLPGKIYSVLPSFLKRIAEVITGLFFNLITLLIGAGRVDKSIPNGDKIKGHISGWGLFDIRNTFIHHPYTLGHDIFDRVEQWRAEEIAKLKASGCNNMFMYKNIEYGLPPEFIKIKK